LLKLLAELFTGGGLSVEGDHAFLVDADGHGPLALYSFFPSFNASEYSVSPIL
jgi:hypothetical protein